MFLGFRLYERQRIASRVEVCIMEFDPEQKALKDNQRKFIHYMVYDGMDRLSAYALAHDVVITDQNKKHIKVRAANLFYAPHVNRYYHSLMEEIRAKEVKKGRWSKELAEEKLIKLIERAEEDVHGDPAHGVDPKQLTMGRLNAIILPIKELNLMNGFNTTNINVDAAVVQIFGEGELKD